MPLLLVLGLSWGSGLESRDLGLEFESFSDHIYLPRRVSSLLKDMRGLDLEIPLKQEERFPLLENDCFMTARGRDKGIKAAKV